MTDYRPYLLNARMLSRERAAEAWAEADRMEALALHAGVVDALKQIGWIAAVDDLEADYGQTRWLLWCGVSWNSLMWWRGRRWAILAC